MFEMEGAADIFRLEVHILTHEESEANASWHQLSQFLGVRIKYCWENLSHIEFTLSVWYLMWPWDLPRETDMRAEWKRIGVTSHELRAANTVLYLLPQLSVI